MITSCADDTIRTNDVDTVVSKVQYTSEKRFANLGENSHKVNLNRCRFFKV